MVGFAACALDPPPDATTLHLRSTKREDRLLVRDGRRSYRRRYSLHEVWTGVVVLALLGLIAAWVGWKGAHPDPSLFEDPILQASAQPVADRGALPAGLAGDGWTETRVAQFDHSNLYEKINGREDYYKSYGFERLYWASLVHDGDPDVTVDIELFDLAKPENALGALAGERPPETPLNADQGGVWVVAQNALLEARGRYYLRVVGSEESERVTQKLEELREVMVGGLAGQALPWAYALFAGMGIDVGRVQYTAEAAYSFDFAKDVWSAVGEDGETESFVVRVAGEAQAQALATDFIEGFLSYGAGVGNAGGWVRDRYLGRVSGAEPYGRWVLGVHSAPAVAAAEAALAALRGGVDRLPLEGLPEGEQPQEVQR